MGLALDGPTWRSYSGQYFYDDYLTFLYTGQMQGFVPVSHSISCGFVSGGCCRFNIALMACSAMVKPIPFSCQEFFVVNKLCIMKRIWYF